MSVFLLIIICITDDPLSSEVLYNFLDSWSVGSLSDSLLVLRLLLSLSFAVCGVFVCSFSFSFVFALTMMILLDIFVSFPFVS